MSQTHPLAATNGKISEVFQQRVAKKTRCIQNPFCYLKLAIVFVWPPSRARHQRAGERRGLSPRSSTARPTQAIQMTFCTTNDSQSHHNSRRSREIRILKRKTLVHVRYTASQHHSTRTRTTTYANCSKSTHFPIFKKPRAPDTFCHLWTREPSNNRHPPSHSVSLRLRRGFQTMTQRNGAHE